MSSALQVLNGGDGKLGCQHRKAYEVGLHTEVCVTGDVCQPPMIASRTTSRALALGDPGADILKGMKNPWGMRSRNQNPFTLSLLSLNKEGADLRFWSQIRASDQSQNGTLRGM